MLNPRDESILADIYAAYKLIYGKEYSVDINRLEQQWKPDDFSENLKRLMRGNLQERSMDIVLSYNDTESKTTYQALGDKYGITRSRVGQIYEKAIFTLAREEMIHQIANGVKPTMYRHEEEKQNETDAQKILEQKKAEFGDKTIDLYEAKGLSVRARNIILRRLPFFRPKQIDLFELQKFETETNIASFQGAGVSTVREIMLFFDSLNIDTSHWKNCLENTRISNMKNVLKEKE